MKPVNHLKRWEDHERQTLIEDVIIGRSWEAVAKSAKRTVAAVMSEYYRIASNPQSDFERQLSTLIDVNHHSYPEDRAEKEPVLKDENVVDNSHYIGKKYIYPAGRETFIESETVQSVVVTDLGRVFIKPEGYNTYHKLSDCEFVVQEFS